MKNELINKLQSLLSNLLESEQGINELKALAIRNRMYEEGALIRDYQLKNFPKEELKSNDVKYEEERRLYVATLERNHFAAMAMQGILSSQTALRGIGACNDERSSKIIALEAVVVADALIKALNKQEGGEV